MVSALIQHVFRKSCWFGVMLSYSLHSLKNVGSLFPTKVPEILHCGMRYFRYRQIIQGSPLVVWALRVCPSSPGAHLLPCLRVHAASSHCSGSILFFSPTRAAHKPDLWLSKPVLKILTFNLLNSILLFLVPLLSLVKFMEIYVHSMYCL